MTGTGKEDQGGLACRYCGCRRFRVIYTRRGWGGKLIRGSTELAEIRGELGLRSHGDLSGVASAKPEAGCRQCGKRPQDVPSGRMTTWERPAGA